MAGDLRTTEIAASHVDLETGRILSAEGMVNYQIAYIEDVIAFVDYVHRRSTKAGYSPALRGSRGWVFRARFATSS